SPFYPVIELIERRFGLDHAQTPALRLARVEQGLADVGLVEPDAVVLLASLLSIPIGDGYAAGELSPAQRRTRTMQLLVAFVAAAARAGSTLLVFEDLHWADTSTLEFLELLVTSAPDVPLLGVFTARPELELSWAGTPALRTIELPRFSRAEAEA